MARGRHREELLLDRDRAIGVRKGVVAGTGTRTDSGAIWCCGIDVGQFGVRRRAGGKGRDCRRALEVGKGVLRVNDTDGATRAARNRHVVRDQCVAITRSVGVPLDMRRLRDGAGCIRRAATTTVVMATTTAEVASTTTATAGGGATITTGSRDAGRSAGARTIETGFTTGCLRATTTAVELGVGLYLRLAREPNRVATCSTMVAVGRTTVRTTRAATATGD